ncbi:Homeodomain-like protein [Phakopsora pachyrhizi]|nr:Homeodomain-like protein [Phakopsora pachyrhizi]
MYGQNWQAVANHCGRSSNQCINRWSKTLRPDIKKGKWDRTEDEALRNAVAACGMVWKDVAPRVRGRTDAQCRERWCNILDPRIVVGNWTAQEDERILSMRDRDGKTWSEISKTFNGKRTDNHCMRRYSELTRSIPKKKKRNSISSIPQQPMTTAMNTTATTIGATTTIPSSSARTMINTNNRILMSTSSMVSTTKKPLLLSSNCNKTLTQRLPQNSLGKVLIGSTEEISKRNPAVVAWAVSNGNGKEVTSSSTVALCKSSSNNYFLENGGREGSVDGNTLRLKERSYGTEGLLEGFDRGEESDYDEDGMDVGLVEENQVKGAKRVKYSQ